MKFHCPAFVTAVLTVLILLTPLGADDSNETVHITWSHKKDDPLGPQNWATKDKLCGADMQSPIDILPRDVIYDRNLQPFDFSDYGLTDKLNLTMVNGHGHYLVVMVDGAQIFLKGGSLPDEYKLVQFHFHWGAESNRGSEHAIDGKFHPMEIHFVHIMKFDEKEEIVIGLPNGLAVMGFFFKVGNKNENYESVIRYLDQARVPGKLVAMETFSLSKLLPASKNFHYYRYFGSLTTPPCYESVIWSLGIDEIEISEEQLNKFRQLLTVDNKPMVDNFRPVQNLNHRSVFTNQESSKSCPTRTPLGWQSLVVLLAGVLLKDQLCGLRG